MPWYESLINIFFPEACVVCGKTDTALCGACLENLPVCTYAPHPFVYPLFSYQNKNMHKIMHGMKYNHTTSITKVLALPMYHALQDALKESFILHLHTVTLLPVPEMRSHTSKRGGNHVHVLAEQIAKHASSIAVVDNAITRVNTKAQRTLSRHERLVNMKNAFEVVAEDRIRNAHIVIIDDVCTTGATIESLRDTCLKAGAKSVIALTVAH